MFPLEGFLRNVRCGVSEDLRLPAACLTLMDMTTAHNLVDADLRRLVNRFAQKREDAEALIPVTGRRWFTEDKTVVNEHGQVVAVATTAEAAEALALNYPENAIAANSMRERIASNVLLSLEHGLISDVQSNARNVSELIREHRGDEAAVEFLYAAGSLR